MISERTSLIQQAMQVLERNWTGTFTRPGALLYHHQWSWDAAFVAMGYAHYNQARAEQELRNLFEGQWSNGLVPHIVFSPQKTDYFPSYPFWEIEGNPLAPRQRQTSGIVQPPVHATAALHIYRHAQDQEQARAFLRELFPRLHAWHAYLYRERDPHQEGLAFIRHSWESLDNSPTWDAIFQRMQLRPEEIPAYQRVDILSVEARCRPRKEDYDRYAYLVKFFAARDYDEARIAADCPFLVQDVLFNALLCQGNRDLAAIARILGEDAQQYEDWAEQTAQAINRKLWHEESGIYQDFDMVAGEHIQASSVASFVPLYAGIPDAERARRLYNLLNSPAFCALDEACYAVPSYDRRSPAFSPDRYWRGPVWININWMLYHGLRRYGQFEYAERIYRSIYELVQQHGFYEYFHPLTGEGLGTYQFSWTAALLIDLLSSAPGNH
ncbi:MAG TPA: trehalase family glycosidase [Ktedonobacteraceae bacterium]|nr:trehalase family glycosidase [Ktedonobacteraceae bacterium]